MGWSLGPRRIWLLLASHAILCPPKYRLCFAHPGPPSFLPWCSLCLKHPSLCLFTRCLQQDCLFWCFAIGLMNGFCFHTVVTVLSILTIVVTCHVQWPSNGSNPRPASHLSCILIIATRYIPMCTVKQSSSCH